MLLAVSTKRFSAGLQIQEKQNYAITEAQLEWGSQVGLASKLESNVSIRSRYSLQLGSNVGMQL